MDNGSGTNGLLLGPHPSGGGKSFGVVTWSLKWNDLVVPR